MNVFIEINSLRYLDSDYVFPALRSTVIRMLAIIIVEAVVQFEDAHYNSVQNIFNFNFTILHYQSERHNENSVNLLY